MKTVPKNKDKTKTAHSFSSDPLLYQRIVENSVEGIFQTTLEGEFIYANPALVKMLGYASQDELFSEIKDIDNQLFVDPERRKELIRVIKKAELVHNFEYQVYKKNGEIIWLNENTRAEKDKKGKISYLEGSAEVVTTRKDAEEHIINLTHSYHRFVPSSLSMSLLKYARVQKLAITFFS